MVAHRPACEVATWGRDDDGVVDSLTNDAEFEDIEEEPGFDLGRLDLRQLRHPVVVRAIAGIVLASAVLLWPQRTDRILARLVGIALIAIASTSIWSAIRARANRGLVVTVGLVGLAIGVFLLISPERSETALGRLIGVMLVAVAVRDVVQVARSREIDNRIWLLARSAAIGGAGALLLLFPIEVLSAMTTIAAIGWIAVSLLVLVVALDRSIAGVANYSDVSGLIGLWLADRPKSVDDRQALYGKVLYDGSGASKRIIRFFTLMTFAAIIASMGVITDSTAVVIGAMLIAPLMTPLMGMAMSLVMGWPNRLARSALIAVGGITLAITIGVLLGLIAPTVIDVDTNSQILARSSPTILDLITAIGAGAAGAYGLSRPDVSDSLPGVAIAISLVPPLTVVGIAWSQGAWSDGNGALLLFVTNMLAILVMGGLTFVVTGVTPIARATGNQHRVRTAIAGVAAMAAIVVGALLLNGAQIASNLLEQSEVQDAVDDWVSGFPAHDVVRIVQDDDVVLVTIVGPSAESPTAASLAEALSDGLERTVTADLRLIVEERDVATVEG